MQPRVEIRSLATFLFGLAALGCGGPAGEGGAPEEAYPPLPPPPTVCRVPAEQAGAWADRARIEADARAARYPFDPRDGVVASSLYAEAAVCAGSAGGEAASDRSSAFRRRLEADYRAHRVALSVALERKDWPAVERGAAWMIRLIPEPPAAYSAWLSEIRRRAEREEHR